MPSEPSDPVPPRDRSKDGGSGPRRPLPTSFYNPITLLGSLIAVVSFGLILFLILLEATSGHQKPYMGIIAFVILPAILLLGLSLVAAGVLRQQYRRRHGKEVAARLPRIDLNDPRHRRAVQLIALGTVLVLALSAFTSFKAYEHTDSDQFCGQTCHNVMQPEYTAYRNSPHARVGCVQCHIGPGAKWFVRAKLSGAYQVYATLFDKYPRPIPTPIDNLRPSRDTCETCHWPQHFFAEKFVQNQYYLSDEQNHSVKLDLSIKIGGGNVESGPTSGIHWHMNVANEVSYIALDRQRTKIPWVRSRSRDGLETVYRSSELPATDDELAKGEHRTMDCIDCHNRPTHIYHPPAKSVNEVMSLGWIDPSLPYVKKVAVEAIDRPYSSAAVAQDSIRVTIESFYRESYPEIAAAKHAQIERAVVEAQRIFSRNFFPEMRVSWRSFPDNIGHMYSLGCFRCHDGKHVSQDGKVLSRECTACHTILAEQIGEGSQQVSLTGVDYQHPEDIGDAWREMNCVECHGPQ
jgi:nitrate/TMAO reductase-like tetraheme cytochrome c subunit